MVSSSPSLQRINLEPLVLSQGLFFMEIITHNHCTILPDNFKTLFELNKQMKERMLFLEEQHRYADTNQSVMHSKIVETTKQINLGKAQMLSLSAVVNFIIDNKRNYFHECETLYGHSVRADFESFISELYDNVNKLENAQKTQTEELNQLMKQSEIAFSRFNQQRTNFHQLYGGLQQYHKQSMHRFSNCWNEVKSACPSLTDELFGGEAELNKMYSVEFFENMYSTTHVTPFYVLMMGLYCAGSVKMIYELIFSYAVDSGWLSSKAALDSMRLINIGSDVASNLAQLEDKIDMMQQELDDLRRQLYKQ